MCAHFSWCVDFGKDRQIVSSCPGFVSLCGSCGARVLSALRWLRQASTWQRCVERTFLVRCHFAWRKRTVIFAEEYVNGLQQAFWQTTAWNVELWEVEKVLETHHLFGFGFRSLALLCILWSLFIIGLLDRTSSHEFTLVYAIRKRYFPLPLPWKYRYLCITCTRFMCLKVTCPWSILSTRSGLFVKSPLRTWR